MEREEIVEKFAEFLKEYYYNDLVSAASEGKKSLLIDFSILDKFNPELADFLLENPEEVLAAAEDSLKQIDLPGSVKLRIRVFNLPEEKQIRIRNIRAEHIGKLISVDGMVKRASEIRPEVSEAIFQCPECGAKITVIQTERFIRPPTECECGNRKNFKFVDQKLYDARWITIEEPFEITSGERPSEIMVFLKEDLTSPKMQNKTDPGNRIKVVGILKQIPRRVKGTRSRQLEIYIDANSIESVEVEWEELEITPEDEKKILELAKDPEIYSKLVASIAPSLYGLDEIKEAIALQLFGGETHVQKDKSRVRGEIHILLVGDPSTAKSALMKVVAGLIPRGRYVSGKGVSVDYDDPVIYMENGIIKTGLIGNVIDRFYKRDEEGFVKVSGISVPSFNPITMKIEWSPVRYVFRHRIKEKMIKMILETGREVKVTSDHSVFVLENGIMTKKADEIKEGDFVVIPKIIPPNPNPIIEIDLKKELEKIPKNERKYIKIVDKKYLKSKFSPHKIPIKIKVDDKLMRLLGYYIADGWLHETKGNSWKIEFEINASDKKTIQDLQKIVHAIFKIKVNVKKRRDSNSCRISVDDKIVFLIFKYILRVGMNAETKKIPEIVFNVSPKLQKEFIKAFVKGDYGVIISKMLMSDLLYLFTLNGVIASFSKRKKEGMIKFPGGRTSYVNGYVFELKSPKPIKILSKMLNNSGLHSRVPIKLVEGLGIDLSKSGYSRISPSAYRFIFSKNRKMLYERLKVMENGIDAKSLSKIIKRNLKSTQQYLNSLVKKGLVEKYKVNGNNAYKLTVIGKRLISKLDLIQKLKDSHLGFVRVKKIEIENPANKYVYDFSVDGKENFIAGFGGVCCHNTGAGLTATVVRDEEFLGGWVLEAGALVMCNRSLIAIDEFEKIEKTDQIALHEAMEQNTISIAKASIVATLPAQTSILAGGNPKLGRFDPYIPIKEQIDVPETLLSRFDLKFALRDIPNPELDAKVAEHILKSRHYGEEEIKPAIEADLLKKYVAYARKNCHPKLSKEAGEEIKNFFLSLREKVGVEEAAVPITLRQYEALIRLAEASAKVQLRDTVTREDAIRAINLMKASLREFGFEAETGRFDVDRLEGRITASERGKIRTVLDIIEELTKTVGNIIPKEDVIKAAKDKGIKEFDVEKILNELKNKGDIFEPKVGFLQKM